MSAPLTFPKPWSELVESAGGVVPLAEAFGVTHMTLWRWAHGESSPSKLARRAVNTWASRRGIAPPFGD